MSANEQRIIDLESKISHQEFLLEKLNEVLYEQQKTVDRLEKSIEALKKRIEGEDLEPKIGPADEKPPHY
ncbi:MAG: SlyX family protein [Bdellovibrionaceae bacterium]|nr:SlyX family protein [Pseudobdellovibrionaceae bacterium]MBX3034967.1 SlyX family protein [Pseudobdellovibrionaceae bacterium]